MKLIISTSATKTPTNAQVVRETRPKLDALVSAMKKKLKLPENRIINKPVVQYNTLRNLVVVSPFCVKFDEYGKEFSAFLDKYRDEKSIKVGSETWKFYANSQWLRNKASAQIIMYKPYKG